MNLQLFRHELDEVDLKFIGFFFTLLAIAVLSALNLKEVVMALIAILGAIIRDLYRKETNSSKNKINSKDIK